jgi:hypothetical protein
MIRSSRGILFSAGLFALILVTGGCGKGKEELVNPGPAMDPGLMGGPGGPGGNSPTARIMQKTVKGPKSLSNSIGRELAVSPTPWDSLQSNSKEFSKLAAELGTHEPSKGSKESWKKYTGAFAETVSALDKAVQDKNLDSAKEAHSKIGKSCKSCHDEHRGMGPGGRGPGGKGPGGRGPGPGGKGMPPG